MVMTPRIGQAFVGWTPPSGGDETLGLVAFAIFPHLGHEMLPWNTLANAEKWAARVQLPGYAMDDETAIKVVDGTVEVVSEGGVEIVYALKRPYSHQHYLLLALPAASLKEAIASDLAKPTSC
jgi:hypothetical protein